MLAWRNAPWDRDHSVARVAEFENQMRWWLAALATLKLTLQDQWPDLFPKHSPRRTHQDTSSS